MTLPEAVKTMPLAQKIKVGANRGTRYFYIGFADDLLKRMSFGNPELRDYEVAEIREADQAADPGTVIIMVFGNDKGFYWSTDESKSPALGFGWGWF